MGAHVIAGLGFGDVGAVDGAVDAEVIDHVGKGAAFFELFEEVVLDQG